MNLKYLLLALVALTVVASLPGIAEARDLKDYAVKDLLEPCVEGDNDSRDGQVLELECEQYINGFTDTCRHHHGVTIQA